MESYKLFLKQIPKDGEFQRAHAVLVTKDGRVLLRYKNGEVRPTTGGHVDTGDENLEATLRREVLEEINCKIERCNYLGYLETMNDEFGSHENWARYVALISEIMPAKPDPDREDNWIYGRVLVPLEKALEETDKSAPLGNTVELVEYAYRIAEKCGYFSEAKNEHAEVLNEESKDSD